MRQKQQVSDVVSIDNSLDSGRKLLSQLMNSGLKIEAAFWTKRPSGSVRLNLVSSDIQNDGPRAVLRKVAAGVAKLNGSSTFSLYDIDVQSPENPEVLNLLRFIGLSNETRFTNNHMDDMLLEDVYIYFSNLAHQISSN